MTNESAIDDFCSRVNGRDYRLLIWVPPVAPPPGGFPVLWVLDGSAYFGLAVDMVRNRGLLGAEITPAVVVGVTYPSEDISVWMTRRYEDLNATPTGGERFAYGAPTGGIESFLDMLADEALPRVESRARIDRGRMAIVGHSLGGHAVLHTLFTRPALFSSYVAISPSIWWHGGELLRHEEGFKAAVESRGCAARVFIGVGGLEQTLYEPRPGLENVDLERANAMIAQAFIIERAEALAARLQAFGAAAGLDVRYTCFPGETHMSVPFAAWRQAMDHALPFGSPP
ncbi:alpha/beta hydrolase [Roseateles violae]|uniref:Alpha/beta hydrolase-fold protein n=1 Tax=Roseateles violae TaxID=3058042 RepID=A0ABT8DT35_9BURK|nr:alpha/beta hydrolase-fold protein [Pelomonas sp. PFR6]MDN3921475.1 alpha/beta hydrolase-fold protein [Pelomonas sp. PFR6]